MTGDSKRMEGTGMADRTSTAHRPPAVDAAWIVVMILVALSPLLAGISAALVGLVGALGLIAGAVVALLRAVLPNRVMPAVFVLTLLIGALVSATDHRSLALSWAGGTIVGILGVVIGQERLRSAS